MKTFHVLFVHLMSGRQCINDLYLRTKVPYTKSSYLGVGPVSLEPPGIRTYEFILGCRLSYIWRSSFCLLA